MTTCKKCLVTSARPEADFDSRGLCRSCRDYEAGKRGGPSPELVAWGRKDFSATVEGTRGKRACDALVCLSGGKDSTYLASLLRGEYGLKLVGFYVAIGFQPAFSRANLDRAADRLGIPLEVFSWPDDFSRRFYRYFFTRPLASGLTGTVCRVCQLAIISAALGHARRRGIPLVLTGYSPYQSGGDWFYELKPEVFASAWRAMGDFWSDPAIPRGLRGRFYLPEGPDGEPPPRLLMPLHVLDYPSEREVRARLAREGLLPSSRSLPRKTKCDLVRLMAYLDTLHFGAPPHRLLVSEKIRRGEASRWKYRAVFRAFSWLCRLGLFQPALVRATLRRIGLTGEEALRCLRESRESDEGYRDVFRMDPRRELTRASPP